VGVRPGDIVTVVNAGGCVQTGGSGAIWKRYVNPDASDAPNLYHGLVGIAGVLPISNTRPLGGSCLQDIRGPARPPRGSRAGRGRGRPQQPPSPQYVKGTVCTTGSPPTVKLNVWAPAASPPVSSQ
jgi:hypothetical protein